MGSTVCTLCKLTACTVLPLRSWTIGLCRRRQGNVNFLLKGSACQRAACSAAEKAEQLQYQAGAFNSQVDFFLEKQPAGVDESLREIVASVPGLGSASRVLDIGSGTGALIPFLQDRGVEDILAVDVAGKMLEALMNRYGQATLGNEKRVRTWLGDICSVPAYQGPFDAAFFNSVFGNILDQREALLHAALLLRPGGRIVVTHPLGREWLEEYRRREDPHMVPNSLPDRPALEGLTKDLPLQTEAYRDEKDLYIAVLQVPTGYTFSRAPIRVEEEVVTGFGRGSKQMGVPTANLAPEALFAGPLDGLPLGVYFGWVQLQGASGPDGSVHKTVLNIGRRPSIEDGEQRTVELHILHKFAQDFYGKRLKVVLLGFIRPEMKFGSLDALINRIKADTGIAKSQLDTEAHVNYAQDAIFSCV